MTKGDLKAIKRIKLLLNQINVQLWREEWQVRESKNLSSTIWLQIKSETRLQLKVCFQPQEELIN